MDFDAAEGGIAETQAALHSGAAAAALLVQFALARIERLDRSGPCLRAVIETNPDAEELAAAADARSRAAGGRRLPPLHGIPVLLKDNIETGDRMQTTAGSLALSGAPAQHDAPVAAALRAAGAILIGKTNLSEWANFRSDHSSSGWSARGGQTRNPHVLDRSPSGSSSGSAAAVAAGYVAAALSTETDGSIVSPATACGVVGIKPTVGLTGQAGVVPISHTQDAVGVHARSVRDAALVLGLIASQPRDYIAGLHPGALRGARIGVARGFFQRCGKGAAVAECALDALRDAGAVLVDPVELPSAQALRSDGSEYQVMLYEFHADLDAYLRGRSGVPIGSLEALVRFNRDHADRELRWFGQEILERALETGPLTEPAYLEALGISRRLGGADGIDAACRAHDLQALVAPTGRPAAPVDLVNGDAGGGGSSGPAARAGYPLVSVPAGMVDALPVNITFMGPAWSERTLIALAHAFECTTQARRAPRMLPTLPFSS